MKRTANGFTVKNWKNLKPIEDAYCYLPEGGLICTADGITRDPHGISILPLRRNLIGMAGFFKKYPKESPALEAAETFCNFFGLLGKYCLRDVSPERARIMFEAGNKEIKRFNDMYLMGNDIGEFDYLENDIPGCTAAGAIISGNSMSYGFIGDCGIAVFDESGKIRFRTPNEGPNSKGSIDEDIKRKYKTDFRHPAGRRIIRGEYRNNPHNPLSYGALTGEDSALEYVRTGQKQINPSDIVVAYTDGLEEAVFSDDFAKKIGKGDFAGIRNLCKKHVKTEGTLVYSAGGRK